METQSSGVFSSPTHIADFPENSLYGGVIFASMAKVSFSEDDCSRDTGKRLY
jgi:hypothetical protein